jgi:hypothetical protein
MYRSLGNLIAGRGGASGKGDMGEVTSAKSLAVLLGGANKGSLNNVKGHGPFLPYHPKLTFSRLDEKLRM